MKNITILLFAFVIFLGGCANNSSREQEKQENLQKKIDIIEKIKAMATSPDEANKSYQTFKELQQQWKEIKLSTIIHCERERHVLCKRT